jgi:hypothetical protein
VRAITFDVMIENHFFHDFGEEPVFQTFPEQPCYIA